MDKKFPDHPDYDIDDGLDVNRYPIPPASGPMATRSVPIAAPRVDVEAEMKRLYPEDGGVAENSESATTDPSASVTSPLIDGEEGDEDERPVPENIYGDMVLDVNGHWVPDKSKKILASPLSLEDLKYRRSCGGVDPVEEEMRRLYPDEDDAEEPLPPASPTTDEPSSPPKPSRTRRLLNRMLAFFW